MKLKHTRNVMHLAITATTVSFLFFVVVIFINNKVYNGKKALRVVLYVAEDKIDWYNENSLHALVLDALYPVVINNLIVDGGADLNKKNKDERDHRVIQSMFGLLLILFFAKFSFLKVEGFRILYRFTQRNSQQTLIETVHKKRRGYYLTKALLI